MKNEKLKTDFKRFTIFGLFIVGLFFILLKLGAYFFVPILTKSLLVSQVEKLASITKLIGTIQNFFFYGFNLIVCIYLAVAASKAKENKLVWASLGLIFGFSAIILFYVFLIFQRDRKDPRTDLLDDW